MSMNRLGRLKFELGGLAEEMLDQLPESVFESETTTFLDPCMGGGQFVAAIERRLRKHGHSDANIEKRVFGVSQSQLRNTYAINKHKLTGQYFVCENYLEYKETMKFDVVIGNPPYQGREDNSDSSLWVKFADKGFSLVNEGGSLLFVTPTSWVGKTSRNKKADFSVYLDNHIRLYKPFSDEDKKKYFPAVGSTFGYYIINHGAGETKVLFGDDSATVTLKEGEPFPSNLNSTSLSIHKKLACATKIATEKNFECHGQKLKNNNLVQDTKSKKYPYKTYYSHNLIRYASIQQSTFADYKVLIPNVSTLKNSFVDRNCNFNEDIVIIPTETRKEAEIVASVLKSKLYTYIGSVYRQGRNLGNCLGFLPEVDFTRTWTDEELYKHFRLTKKEIQYIEETVK